MPCLSPVGMAKVVPNSATTASGRASVGDVEVGRRRDRAACRARRRRPGAPGGPRSRSRWQTASTSVGTSARSASVTAVTRPSSRAGRPRLERRPAPPPPRSARPLSSTGPLARAHSRPANDSATSNRLSWSGPLSATTSIDGRRLPERLRPLLQPRLVVEPRVRVDVGQLGLKQPRRRRRDGVETAVEIDRAHQRLQRVGQDRRTRTPAGALLAASDERIAPQIERAPPPAPGPLRSPAPPAPASDRPRRCPGKRRMSRSLTTSASTASPRNSSRSLSARPGAAPRYARRCASARSRPAPDRGKRSRGAPPARRARGPPAAVRLISSRIIGLLVSAAHVRRNQHLLRQMQLDPGQGDCSRDWRSTSARSAAGSGWIAARSPARPSCPRAELARLRGLLAGTAGPPPIPTETSPPARPAREACPR